MGGNEQDELWIYGGGRWCAAEAMWSCATGANGFVITLAKGALQRSPSTVYGHCSSSVSVRATGIYISDFLGSGKRTNSAHSRQLSCTMADSQQASGNGGAGGDPTGELTAKQLKKKAQKEAKKAKFEKKMEENKKQEQLTVEVTAILSCIQCSWRADNQF